MKQYEIIEMARQVGYPIQHPEWQKATEEFAALVAAKEREACAKVVDDIEAMCIAKDVDDPPLNIVAEAIRARGQA